MQKSISMKGKTKGRFLSEQGGWAYTVHLNFWVAIHCLLSRKIWIHQVLPQLVWKLLARLNVITQVCDDLMVLAFLYLRIGTAFYAARYSLNSHSWASVSTPWSRAATPSSQRWGMQPYGKACRRKSGFSLLLWPCSIGEKGRSRLCSLDQLEVFIQQ